MTSRATHGNDFLRALLMPALAVGLVVGCAPAKGGGSGGGNTGQSGGNSSSPGSTSNPSGGNTGNPGSTSNPSGGNTSNPGSTSNPSGGNTSNPGSTSNPSGGNTSNPGSTNTSNPGSTSNPSGGNTSSSSKSSGGTTSSSGGTTSSSSRTSGGTTSSSGGTTSSSGGTTSSSGGTTSSSGGGTTISGNPPGWWQTSDWNVTSANWHGCVWTGVDSTVAGSTTSITPQDFTSATKEGGPYEVSGTVFNDYNAVAMIGFNLNESATGSSTQCKYNPAAALAAGPPVATVPSSATGIAVNWSAKIAPVTAFRIQIQGVNGATDATDRWCATIQDAQGPSFIPFSSFNTQCWTGATNPVAYNNQPIDAVVFLVPGTITAKAPFDFTITGFAPGTSKSDAPGGAAACGTMTGTVGSATQLSGQASIDAATQRAAVTGTDCKKYIINNNNWGNESGTYQELSYTGNSFTDVVTSGSGGGANVVAFPSIYIGANGQIGGGTFNTWSDSGLPKQISAMQSVQTSFKWSGGTSGGNYNAAYDVWFAKSPPTAGSYNDAVSGFIMVWLYKPAASQPIGSSGNTRTATIAGHTWTVWRGPRVGAATGTDGTGRPVISYVANDSPVSSLTFDLKNFIDDAVTNASADMSAGGTSEAFSGSWYLTDVFAGFEIWNGSDAKGLQDTFTCVVQ